MDTLHIKNLTVFANHGVFSAEKELGQKFELDVVIGYEMTEAATTGNLAASIHYGELCQQLTNWTQEVSHDLIETAAYDLIERVFRQYPQAQSVELTLKKPWAPVHLPLETCAVTLFREKRRAFIGLGTNMGNKVENLKEALTQLEQANITIMKQSSILETAPWGGVEQDSFLNQVVEVETWLTPDSLMQTLLAIETNMGRVREIKWGPRLIDLDILFIEQAQIYTDSLIVPHPYVAERSFVLQSLVEIAPHFVHPVLKKSMRQLLEALNA